MIKVAKNRLLSKSLLLNGRALPLKQFTERLHLYPPEKHQAAAAPTVAGKAAK